MIEYKSKLQQAEGERQRLEGTVQRQENQIKRMKGQVENLVGTVLACTVLCSVFRDLVIWLASGQPH